MLTLSNILSKRTKVKPHVCVPESSVVFGGLKDDWQETADDFSCFTEAHVKTAKFWPPLIQDLLSGFYWKISVTE